jgi:uncharacterized membrane protein
MLTNERWMEFLLKIYQFFKGDLKMKNMRNLFFIGLLSGFAALLVGCATTNNMVSDSHNPDMTKILYEVDINVPKTETWEVLADFANLSWTESVTSAHYLNDKREGLGMARHCELKDGGYIVERITKWKEGSGFAYSIDDASDPVSTDSYVLWKIRGNEDRSKVTFEVHYKLKYGIIGKTMNVLMAKKKFSKQIVQFMGELKDHLEKRV